MRKESYGFIKSHSSLLKNEKIYLRKSVFYTIIGTVWPEIYEEKMKRRRIKKNNPVEVR